MQTYFKMRQYESNCPFHIKFTEHVNNKLALKPAFCACGLISNAEETNNSYLNVPNQVRLIRTK